MFLLPRKPKTTVFTKALASGSKNHRGAKAQVLTQFSACCKKNFPCQRHKNTVTCSVLVLGKRPPQKKRKFAKKCPTWTSKKRLVFIVFSPTPDPEKRCVEGVGFKGLHPTGITFSWQPQYFKQMERTNRKTHWYEAVGSAFNFPFSKEVSLNSFVFDVVNFKN